MSLSDRRPVRIDPKDWPTIASAHDWHGGAYDFQANQVWTIKVRQHADGRRLVYGFTEAGPGGMPTSFRGASAGYLVAPTDGVPDDDETVRSVRRVAGVIHNAELADACIADMPAETI